MTAIEHRRNGKRVQPPSSARQAAESLFKKSPASGSQSETPAPSEKPAATKAIFLFESQASIRVSHAAVFQLTIRVGRQMWIDLGRPLRFDLTGSPDEGYELRPGTKFKTLGIGDRADSKASVYVSVTAKFAHLPLVARNAANVGARVTGSGSHQHIKLEPVPAEWTGRGSVPQAEPAADEGTVLDAQNQKPDQLAEEHQNSDLGEVSLRVNGAGFSLVFKVPSRLMGRIKDPKRVYISGNPHEGWIMRESHDLGVQVNYQANPNFVYLTKGLSDQKIPDHKKARKWFSVRMTVEGDAIKIAGPNYEWIRGAMMWLKDPPVAPLAHVTNGHNGHHEGHSGNGHQGVSPLPKQDALKPTGTAAELQVRLAAAMAEATALKTAIEEMTGLRFAFSTKNGVLAVGLVPAGFVPPKDQGPAVKITGSVNGG